MIAALRRVPGNPIVRPDDISWTRASGAFNPAAVVCHKTDRVALLVRVFEVDTGRSAIALAVSSDGVTIDYILDRPAIAREAPYEEWGVEDMRATWLPDEGRYAITYTGYSAAGPRVCLITTDDILDPSRYRRHGPRIEGDNKNTVVFPTKIDGRYVIVHRPMPNAVLTTVSTLEAPWPATGTTILGPVPGTWRSSRVGAGAPPLDTPIGWLMPFHGATSVPEGNVYSMGWALLDRTDPTKVLYVSDAPALRPEAPYEIHEDPIPQVSMDNFPTAVRVVFPEGLVERGHDLIVYYGAADVFVAAARVGKAALLDSISRMIAP